MSTYYVGWDVGAWHCDKNSDSKDCLCLLKEGNNGLEFVTKRFCVREHFIQTSLLEFLNFIFQEIKNEDNENIILGEDDRIILAIDAVFCWPKMFVDLIRGSDLVYNDFIIDSGAINNKILYRNTEQIIAKRHKPISVVQGQIGSQSTKIMYFLKRYGFMIKEPGIWQTSNGKITAIETYPAVLDGKAKHDDETDAKLCATLAFVFAEDLKTKKANKRLLNWPTERQIDSASNEGWIWVPNKSIPNVFPNVIVNDKEESSCLTQLETS